METRIALICVGTELLRGKINTHASTLARALSGIGLRLSGEQTVADDFHDLVQAIRIALAKSQVVIVTGGLGPTFDDVTREAAAQATGRPLVPSAELIRGIQAKFRRARYRKMPPANARQADVLKGATAMSNEVGTAPGQWLVLSPLSSHLILLPGPPSEMEPMLKGIVLPRLQKLFSSSGQAEAHLHFVGVPESVIDHQVRPVIAREIGVDFTILAHPGAVDLDIFVRGRHRADARARLERIVRSIRRRTGKSFFGRDADFPLEKVIANQFISRRETLAVAESCTGGLLAKLLTDISGSSRYFLEGGVTYTNPAKIRQLGVEPKVFQKYGAVSGPVATAMAQGIRVRAGATVGVGITGIAGPTGGTPQKPVGLVYIACSKATGTVCKKFEFRGSRQTIRARAVLAALDMIRRPPAARN